ncbi:hypothetical protein NZD89_03485 [Alicyclobacillus fastidiosus]|uniref:Small EDRK-rich factor-like N-terminal domain-containing protein n=1 Tax=Alicyclobacillus fastidiosus TaxID=392011 RepID=A0ABY6ZI64_9BACL|nr:hypothetical protein [Alicyclobacillus fastidiosus]WAH42564.1 hypothetical protein NZD89_03485 [Alicyclobacillus fastidiosus]GMA64417.1 hypothetical protein GCM10025859_48570 [Alicyclobacillus fastidiosus]
MPKAENRKRPPNSIGRVTGNGKRQQADAMVNNPDHQKVQNKKQELLEKMRTLQKSRKAADGTPE